MKVKVEIELSAKTYKDLCTAAKNLKVTPIKFAVRAIERSVRQKQVSGHDVTASLNKFFDENPELVTLEAQRLWEK